METRPGPQCAQAASLAGWEADWEIVAESEGSLGGVAGEVLAAVEKGAGLGAVASAAAVPLAGWEAHWELVEYMEESGEDSLEVAAGATLAASEKGAGSGVEAFAAAAAASGATATAGAEARPC